MIHSNSFTCAHRRRHPKFLHEIQHRPGHEPLSQTPSVAYKRSGSSPAKVARHLIKPSPPLSPHTHLFPSTFPTPPCLCESRLQSTAYPRNTEHYHSVALSVGSAAAVAAAAACCVQQRCLRTRLAGSGRRQDAGTLANIVLLLLLLLMSGPRGSARDADDQRCVVVGAAFALAL